VNAVVVQHPRRMVRLTRHVGLGKFRPEAGRFDQIDGCQVVGMAVDPIWRQQKPRLQLAKHAGQQSSGVERGFHAAVLQTQVSTPGPLPGFSWRRQSRGRESRECQRVLVRRRSSPARPRDIRRLCTAKWPRRRPNSASSGCGATTNTSSGVGSCIMESIQPKAIEVRIRAQQ